MMNVEWQQLPVTIVDGVLRVGDHIVMDELERPIMQAVADEARHAQHILEVGYGLGVLSVLLHDGFMLQHTIIEAHPVIAQTARDRFSSTSRIKEGWWQDIVPTLPDASFDAVIHDWYIARPDDGTEAFAPHAARLLRPGGIYIPWSTEAYTYDPSQLKALLEHFAEVKLVKVACVPCSTRHEPQIVLAVCRKEA